MSNTDPANTLALIDQKISSDTPTEVLVQRAKEIRDEEKSRFTDLSETRIILGRILQIAVKRLRASDELDAFLADCDIPKARVKAYTNYYQAAKVVREHVLDQINGQKLLAGVPSKDPTPIVVSSDPLAEASDHGKIAGIDFGLLPALRDDIEAKSKSHLSQSRQDVTTLERLAQKMLDGEQLGQADATDVFVIRTRCYSTTIGNVNAS
jgi:hypothetical protein